MDWIDVAQEMDQWMVLVNYQQYILFSRETGWDCMDWIDVAQEIDQWMVLVNTIMKLRVP
jgi:hypothetical protein